MSGSGRKRSSSKWDSKEEPQISYKDENDINRPTNTSMPSYGKELQHDRLPLEAFDGYRSKWTTMEPFHGTRGSRRDDGIDEDYNRTLNSTSSRDGADGYGTRMSPGVEQMRQKKHQHSPRSRRSPSQSRSRSRSRSRSPVRGLRRNSGAYDRSRNRSGATTTLCRDFAAGRCRRGNHCPFAHEAARINEDNFERQRRDEDRRHRDASLDRLGGRDTRKAANDIPCRYFASGNCRNGRYCRFSHDSQTRRSPDRRLQGLRLPLEPSAVDVENLRNANLSGENDEKIEPQESRIAVRHKNDGWGHSLDEMANGMAPIDHTTIDNNRDAIHLKESVGDNPHAIQQVTNDNWLGDTDMSPEWNYRVRPLSHIDKGEGASISSEPNFPQAGAVAPPMTSGMPVKQDYNVREVGSHAPLFDDMNLTGKTANSHILPATQEVPPVPVPFLSSNSVMHTQGTITNPQNQPFIQDGRLSDKQNFGTNASQMNSGGLAAQSLASSELTQLTHLSASLAQLLANGQQLPQLYAVHNSHSTDVPSFANPEASSKQMLAANEIVPDLKKEHPYKDYLPNQLEQGAKPNVTRENKGLAAEEKPKTDSEENKTIQGNNEGHPKPDETKKTKEAKGSHTFKFALVEFVKELLKPAWKEGQISKDAYKNIVKKVVDKVTGTMQGASVPQTQEKIESYLSTSKPKLTKLVQAYVEKERIQKNK